MPAPSRARGVPTGALTRPSRTSVEGGFTLIEVVVAIGVLAVMATALSGLLINLIRLTATNQHRVIAANVAHQQVEYVQAQMPKPTTGTSSGTTDPINNTVYSYTVTVTWVTFANNASVCDGGPGTGSDPKAYYRVDVSVTWPQMTIPAVTSQTLLWPGKEQFTTTPGGTNTGWVKVLNKSGGPASGITVTLTNTSTTLTTPTDSSGCATFTNVAAGSYTAYLSTSGYTDPTGNNKPSKGLTVVANQSPAGWTVTYGP